VSSLISKTKIDLLKKLDQKSRNILHTIANFEPSNDNENVKFQQFQDSCTKLLTAIFKKFEKKDDLKVLMRQKDSSGKIPLHYASKVGNVTVMNFLLENDSKSVNSQDKLGMTPLMLACQFNQSSVANLLMEISDLTLVDVEKKTPLIHLVHPSPFGCFENLTLLNSIIKKGCNLHSKDQDGNNATYYASVKYSKKIYNELVKLGGKKKKGKEVEFKNKTPNYSTIDFQSDFEKAKKIQLESETIQKEEKEQEVKVDSRSQLKNCKVLQDEDGRYFDVLLSKADVLKGLHGYYVFYKLQIIYNPMQKIYILFNCWGRWGDDGEHQRTPFKSKEDAVKEFKSLYKSKTKNEWENEEFEEHLGSYTLLKLKKKKKLNRLPILDLKNTKASSLDISVFQVLKEITSVTSMTKSLHSNGVSGEVLPFGDLDEDVLNKGISILKKISELIQEINNREIAPEEKKIKLNEIAKQSNQFYQLIPHEGFEDSSLGLIRNEYEVSEKIQMIDLLMNLEISSKCLLASNYNSKKMNPLDYCYLSLKNEILPLDSTSMEFSILKKYFTQSNNEHYELLNIFSLNRKGEEERFQKYKQLENRTLLWHGSPVSNFIGILSNGLKIAPPEAPKAGFMFGKGIYFADMFSKSVNYSNRGDSSVSLLLLCEVALGNISVEKEAIYMEKPKPNTNSTKGLGRIGPSLEDSYMTNGGIKIPCGPLQSISKETVTCLQANEFIVYDEGQVKMKYLVMVKKMNF
jgi:predicted DNA-binding WGR domain protein